LIVHTVAEFYFCTKGKVRKPVEAVLVCGATCFGQSGLIDLTLERNRISADALIAEAEKSRTLHAQPKTTNSVIDFFIMDLGVYVLFTI